MTEQSNSYLVLARKYRPNNFNELVGQEVLVRTLSNAIKSDRLHHAYLLTGIRGVGKTTTARIIAKTANCLAKTQAEISCDRCESCLKINSGHHPDVIEIDAASKTGVDDMREIIESAAYAPILARYKIYIIDEVHMLSTSAFNALLKTLEEPPAHLKFIFATTEVRKVPLTILSRCQKFNLRRLDEKEIADHLKNILAKENFKADELALNLIAKASEGSVRDALSLLDQALSLNNYAGNLELAVVENMLALSNKNSVIALLEALLLGDFTLSLKIFRELYSASLEASMLISDLLELVHRIILVKLISDYKLDDYSKWQQEKINEIAARGSLPALTRVWQMLLKGNAEVSSGLLPKATFEMLLVRICYLASLLDPAELLTALNPKVTNSKTEKLEEVINEQENITLPEPVVNKEIDNEIVRELLLNFPQAKLIK